MDALATLAAAGFDVAHPFDAAAAAGAPGLAILAGAERRGLLIGNTRALWPRFIDALRDPALAAEPDPLDRYTERAIAAAFPAARIYFGHCRYAGSFVPLQHLAVATGLGALAPSHLVIHPIYGPWFALRAAVLLDGDPPPLAPGGSPPLATPADPPPGLPIAQPCRCDANCATALARAQRTTDALAWLAVRDACHLRAFRYSDDQIAFHYSRAWPARSDG